MKFNHVLLAALMVQSGGVLSAELDSSLVGTTDLYFRKYSSDIFEKTKYIKPDWSPNACISPGDEYEIRLDTVVFKSSYDGFAENVSEWAWFNYATWNTNEIGVFVSIDEQIAKAGKDASAATANAVIKDRLVHSSTGRKPGHPINALNKLVYSGKYQGGNLNFILEVREFDKDNGEGVQALVDAIVDAGSKIANVSSPVASKLLDSLGASAKNGLFRDDQVMHYNLDFVPCGVYRGNPEQLYLSEGQLLFVRTPPAADYSRITEEISWDGSLNYPMKNKVKFDSSFVSIRVYKKN